MNRVFPNLQNTNAELSELNVTLLGEDQTLVDKGVSTGVQAGHGVDFSIDATNSLGQITGSTRSDPETMAETNYDDPNVFAQSAGNGDGFTGSLGTFDAGSDAPGEENANCNDTESGESPYA